MSDEWVQIRIPATYQSLKSLEQPVEGVLAGVEVLAEPESTAYNVLLALHELCTNIIRHAYVGEPGWIAIAMRIERQPLQLRISVLDQGSHTFDLNQWLAPDLSEPSNGGMGLWLITQLMDEVQYQPCAGDNRWHLVKTLTCLAPNTSHPIDSTLTTSATTGSLRK